MQAHLERPISVDLSVYGRDSMNSALNEELVRPKKSLTNGYFKLSKEELFVFFRLGLTTMKFLFNLMGVILCILTAYTYQPDKIYGNDDRKNIAKIKLFLTFVYLFEYSYEIYEMIKNKIKPKFIPIIFYFDTLGIVILVLSSSLYLFDNTSNNYKIASSLEDTIFCCRIIKLQKYVKFFFYYIKNEENHSRKVVEINEIKLAFIDLILYFISYLFVSTAIILSFDHLYDCSLFSPFSKSNPFSWHNALYYQLVTMTGIGYGDISPNKVQSRLVSMFLILFLTIQFTYFLTIFITLMIKNKSINKYLPATKGWKNHIIIIGNVLSSQFLTEHFFKNHFSDLYKDRTKKMRARIVFIYHKEPSHQIMNYLKMKYFQEFKKVRFIQNSLNEQSWMKDANIQTAKYLICFYVKTGKGMNDQEYIEYERGILNNLHFISTFYPKINFFVSVDSSHLKREIKSFNYQTVLSYSKIKRKIISLSIENSGFGNLFFSIINGIDLEEKMKIQESLKKETTNKKSLELLMNYVEGAFSMIRCFKLPDTLIRHSFKKVGQIIYFIDFFKCRKKHEHSFHFNYRAILIGIKKKLLNLKPIILLNPLNYTISEGDFCYVLCNEESVIQKIQSLTNDDIIFASKQLDILMSKNILSRNMDLIQNLMVHSKSEYQKKFKIIKNYFNFQHCHSLDEDYNPADFPTQILYDHVIIFGAKIDSIYGLSKNIKKYSKRPLIFLGSQKMSDTQFHSEILNRSFNDVFYFYGDYFNIQKLNSINVKDAFKIIIVSELKNQFFIDFHAIQTYQFLRENFWKLEIFLELLDENSLSFISDKLYQKEFPKILNPLNITGRVFFSQSIACSLNASCFYKSGEILLELLDSESFNPEMIQNKSIENLVITDEIANNINSFGNLFYVFSEMNFPIIPIGILKKGRPPLEESIFFPKRTDIYSWEQETLINMPPCSLKLDEGDVIYLIGNFDCEEISFFEKKMRTFKKVGEMSLMAFKSDEKKWNQRIEIKKDIINILGNYIKLMKKLRKIHKNKRNIKTEKE